MFSLNGLRPLRQVIDNSGDSEWLLGHAHGAAGLAPYYGRDYCNEDKKQYREGWQTGNASRVLSGADDHGWQSPNPSVDDDSDYANMRIDERRPDSECPDFIVAFTMTETEWREKEQDDEPDPWTAEEWNRSRGLTVRGRAVHNA